MGNNLYWNVYKSLERELLSLAEIIHIDDSQLDVYSMKIADLLIRTTVEIESISRNCILEKVVQNQTIKIYTLIQIVWLYWNLNGV